MRVGEVINTSLGKVMVLEVQKDYLILFNKIKSQFIKANSYQSNNNKVFWDNGEYYNSFNELVENINN